MIIDPLQEAVIDANNNHYDQSISFQAKQSIWSSVFRSIDALEDCSAPREIEKEWIDKCYPNADEYVEKLQKRLNDLKVKIGY